MLIDSSSIQLIFNLYQNPSIMTQLQHQEVKMLIPDLLPPDHVSLNTKRIRFIKGQGVLIYDDKYVVEIYAPYSRTDDLEFFGIQRHHGKKIENR